MFLIKSTYIGKAKTKKLVFWGKTGNYWIANYNGQPAHSWAVVCAIGLQKHAEKRLDKIPERLWIEDADYKLMKNEIIKVEEEDDRKRMVK